MPVIVFASSKGGAGKTTCCMVLASELARNKARFVLIDADPNQHLAEWGRAVGAYKVIASNQSTILDDIQMAEKEAPFVIVDLEGTANIAMSYAISMADLVIVPCKPSDLDGKEAIKIAGFIKQQEKAFNKKINFALLRTQTSAAIHTKIERAIVDDFRNLGSDIFENRLIEREAFRSIISYNCYIHELETTNTREEEAKKKAIDTAKMFALEMAQKMEQQYISKQQQMEVAHG